MSALARAARALLALALFGGATFVALQHPLWPALALIVIIGLAIAEFLHPGMWLFAMPAALPLANLSPWTGWSMFEEFDLIALALLAGGHFRLALRPLRDSSRAAASVPVSLFLAFAGLTLLALIRGLIESGTASFGWFQGYADPLNALRVGKSTLYALLALPLLQRATACKARANERFAAGMIVGLIVVSAVTLWERAAYPGLLNLAAHYRTSALFWEMHVGGAAIDGYLVLATPFVGWALWSARSPLQWGGAAALALATVHAGLSTFSRGVYGAVVVSLLALSLLLLARSDLDKLARWRRAGYTAGTVVGMALPLVAAFAGFGYVGVAWALIGIVIVLAAGMRFRPKLATWRRVAAATLAMALMIEVIAVFGEGSYMLARMASGYGDFGGRTAHWSYGVELLHDASQWLLGRGLGRLPADYAAEVPRREFSGAVSLTTDANGSHAVSIAGPRAEGRLGGLFSLTQRIRREPAYRLRFEVRAPSRSDIRLAVCERHLIYDEDCRFAFVRVEPDAVNGRHIELHLDGFAERSDLLGMHGVVFDLSVINANGRAEFRDLAMTGPDDVDLIANGNFSRGLAHWLPTAREYFLPWHIDNLYLELLIERGALSVLVFVALALTALRRLTARANRSQLAPFLAASLCGVLTLGAVDSLFDVPRVAFLVQLLLLISLQRVAAVPPQSSRN